MRHLLIAFLAVASPLEAQWSVSAVRYATIKGFPVAALVKDADTTRRLCSAPCRIADRIVGVAC